MSKLKCYIKECIEESIIKTSPKEYMTVEEWADYIGIGRTTAYTLVGKKSLSHIFIRIGKRRFVIRKLWDEFAVKMAKNNIAL